ncbi:MAG: hypothetical protein EU540_00735 [Promethearchaeota archaeon]|nr:MAG: hypothetical protein EU540_00735 [Candidatus Lokiarchaeota archaeon]
MNRCNTFVLPYFCAIRLTKKGKILAVKLTETHALLKRFFNELLEINDKDLIERISCDIIFIFKNV